MSTSQRREMIMLPVPPEHYDATVAFLGQRIAGGASAPAATDITQPIAGGNDFPPDVLQRIKTEPQFPIVKAMLDLVAERPEKPVTLDEVMSRAGVAERRDARGQLAAFTKMLKRWGVGRWPIRAERDANGRVFYLGTKEFAKEWKKKP